MRAISNRQFLETKFKSVEFTGCWLDSIGRPSLSGNWIISGKSYSGKTSFALQLAKYLTTFDRVAYDSLEQGECSSLQLSWKREGMQNVGTKIQLLHKAQLADLREFLSKRKSPNIVIIDSVRYMFGMKLTDVAALNADFPNKLFIWLSHERNGEPKGDLAQAIKYDADVKIWVEGFRAFVESRYTAKSAPYTIYEEGAEKYWLDKKEKK